ncbi:hypothetical protein RSOLAG22IIIB_02350 [Rhizoctonia solani]|uniref:GATA-type domain-containing protein n=1 Tax=Rhizoctonia solani TaxID=456999 RepID=A0A0K6GE32_9AGAM|nr:hypothetical protein RSOLAG22IIIB_02350 [Rhizoctonia solani]
MEDELRPLPEHDDGHEVRPRAHSVMPPRRSGTYDSRTDPRGPPPRRQSTSAVGLPAPAGPGWHSPPPPQSYYPHSQQDAFGAHAYIEPRGAPPMPPPPPAWAGASGYQLPPPQGFPQPRPQPARSPPPGAYDPRYRQPAYAYPPPPPGYGAPPYPPGPSGPTVDPTIFSSRHPGMPASPPDPTRPDVQITYTDDSATKLTQYLRRRCFNCRVTEPPGWRKSTLNPGKIVCNKCGLYERSHARPRPLHMDNPKGPTQ